MRRYRVARFMIDGTRETLTNEKIPAEHKEHIIERIKERHGTDDHEAKLKRYLDLKSPNFMVVPDYVNILNFFWTPGVPFVRKNREKEPVVREFILPNCALVTYKHTVELGSEIGKMVIRDDRSVPDKDVTDEKFIELVKKFR